MVIPAVTLYLDVDQRKTLIRVIKFWLELNKLRPKEDTARTIFFLQEILKMLEKSQK